MTPCEFCNGTGSIILDDFTTKQCRCAYTKELAARLGPELANAEVNENGPLYVYGDIPGQPKVDKTRTNLLIRGRWKDVTPHLKWALIARGSKFYTKIVTDQQLKHVYVGNTSARVQKNGSASYESLSDFVGEDWNLVIVRLGVLSNSNKAMPGIIQETMLMRQVALKPTWLVEDPENQNKYWYNRDVEDYLSQNNYEVIEIREGSKPTPQSSRVEVPQPSRIEEVVERPARKSSYDGDLLAKLGIPEESPKRVSKWKKH
jgi:hypothetical protein